MLCLIGERGPHDNRSLGMRPEDGCLDGGKKNTHTKQKVSILEMVSENLKKIYPQKIFNFAKDKISKV